MSIILLLTIDAGLMQETGSIPLLAGLLEHVDRFNHLAPGHERDDNEDLAWPGIMGIATIVSFIIAGLRWFIVIHCGLECNQPFILLQGLFSLDKVPRTMRRSPSFVRLTWRTTTKMAVSGQSLMEKSMTSRTSRLSLSP